MTEVKVKLIDGGKLPLFKTVGASCADCYARLITPYVIVPAGKRCLVSLGFALELPSDYEAVIRPRSGLTSKGIDVGIGTIDEDYRGEVKACVINNSGEDFKIENLDRICQLKIQKSEKVSFVEVTELSETERNTDGFGSTGIK